MGSLGPEGGSPGAGDAGGPLRRKPRLLCLHGYRTSGRIMRAQVVGKWPAWVTDRLDLVFADAPFPADGESGVERIFPPPYYEWFKADKEYKEYWKLEECFAYIEELMIKHGPFDGLMGFSQGAMLSGALPRLQANGVALTKVPKIKYVIIIGAGKFRSPMVAEKAYSGKNDCKSLHFLGDSDFQRKAGEELLESFYNPFVIRHSKGHTIPRIDDKSLVTMRQFLQEIETDLRQDANIDNERRLVEPRLHSRL